MIWDSLGPTVNLKRANEQRRMVTVKWTRSITLELKNRKLKTIAVFVLPKAQIIWRRNPVHKLYFYTMWTSASALSHKTRLFLSHWWELVPQCHRFLPPATKLGQGYVFTCLWFCSRVGCLVQGGVCSRGETPPVMATAAGGTHPTGMHSC